MMEQLSIQNFYRREVGNSSSTVETKGAASSSPPPGDGFSRAEVDAVVRPDGLPQWKPPQEYEKVDVTSIRPGPGCVAVTGRILNFTRSNFSSQPPKPSGYLYLFVKDDTGVIAVRQTSRVASCAVRN